MPQIMLLLVLHPWIPWNTSPGVRWTAVSSAGTQWEKTGQGCLWFIGLWKSGTSTSSGTRFLLCSLHLESLPLIVTVIFCT